MGTVKSITADRFPRQGEWVGRQVKVFFHYDASREFPAVVVRDDREDPYVMIIRLEDGRYVLATECQYAPC